MIKILAACGAGVNSSHQIKDAIETQLGDRGYNVHCDAVMVKDITEEMVNKSDIFTPIDILPEICKEFISDSLKFIGS